MALLTLFCCHSRTFSRISVVFFQWNFAGVPRVCPPLIRQTIQLPRPHRKRKLDVTRPATAPRKIVTNKQRWPKIIQRNAVGQLTLKNVWKTKMFGYFQNTPFQPQTASRGKRVRLMFCFSSVCVYEHFRIYIVVDTNIAQLRTQWGGSESPNWISERQPSRFLLIENQHCFILRTEVGVTCDDWL